MKYIQKTIIVLLFAVMMLSGCSKNPYAVIPEKDFFDSPSEISSNSAYMDDETSDNIWQKKEITKEWYEAHTSGLWHTASIGYVDENGEMQPEWYVKIDEEKVIYGHLKGGEFISDHENAIISYINFGEDTLFMCVESKDVSSKTHRYFLVTSDDDINTLEYYEETAPDESENGDMAAGMTGLDYCGGVSLVREVN